LTPPLSAAAMFMPREAALTLARSRVGRAMTYQRWHA
jgi:hypothetical protein